NRVARVTSAGGELKRAEARAGQRCSPQTGGAHVEACLRLGEPAGHPCAACQLPGKVLTANDTVQCGQWESVESNIQGKLTVVDGDRATCCGVQTFRAGDGGVDVQSIAIARPGSI